MLNVLLIVAAAYLLYTWGIRLLMRGLILGKVLFEMYGYVCSMAAGTTLALYLTLSSVGYVYPQASVLEISVVSTGLSILFGEYIYVRSSRLSLQLLATLRSKEQKR